MRLSTARTCSSNADLLIRGIAVRNLQELLEQLFSKMVVQEDDAKAAFYLLSAQRLRTCDGGAWPGMQEAWNLGWLERRQLDLRAACRGEFASSILAVSHKWETARHPDPRGEQFGAIRELLLEDTK